MLIRWTACFNGFRRIYYGIGLIESWKFTSLLNIVFRSSEFASICEIFKQSAYSGLRPWRWMQHVPPKRRFPPTRLHSEQHRRPQYERSPPWKPQNLLKPAYQNTKLQNVGYKPHNCKAKYVAAKPVVNDVSLPHWWTKTWLMHLRITYQWWKI
jgi:hypothetical protein